MAYLLTTPQKNYVLAPARLFWQMCNDRMSAGVRACARTPACRLAISGDGFNVLACTAISNMGVELLTDVVSAADGTGSLVRQIVACARGLPA